MTPPPDRNPDIWLRRGGLLGIIYVIGALILTAWALGGYGIMFSVLCSPLLALPFILGFWWMARGRLSRFSQVTVSLALAAVAVYTLARLGFAVYCVTAASARHAPALVNTWFWSLLWLWMLALALRFVLSSGHGLRQPPEPRRLVYLTGALAAAALIAGACNHLQVIHRNALALTDLVPLYETVDSEGTSHGLRKTMFGFVGTNSMSSPGSRSPTGLNHGSLPFPWFGLSAGPSGLVLFGFPAWGLVNAALGAAAVVLLFCSVAGLARLRQPGAKAIDRVASIACWSILVLLLLSAVLVVAITVSWPGSSTFPPILRPTWDLFRSLLVVLWPCCGAYWLAESFAVSEQR